VGLRAADSAGPFHEAELIFPLEEWHNHASSVVVTPSGDVLVCWFHGSGERTADDVKVEGARRRRGAREWSERFVMADTPGYPDTNCTMFVDPEGRLWLMWPTILANEWHTALMKYRVSRDYEADGPPRWATSEVLHVTPGPGFEASLEAHVGQLSERLGEVEAMGYSRERAEGYLELLRERGGDKLYRRLGWMTRAHPFVLDGRRLIVPLYSDGFDFSLMAITDDWGASWRTSNALCGLGNVQPSIVRRQDGSLYTLMRDNGPPPKRLLQSESFDGGETWGPVTDSELPNPGSGAEIIGLQSGRWLLINNDTERGRHSLVVQLSDDEGKTWKWHRHLEQDTAGPEAGAYHYPSVVQAGDGTLHATYSYHLNRGEATARKSIKHAHFNEAWIMEDRR
jgi:predicted neuraminidase